MVAGLLQGELSRAEGPSLPVDLFYRREVFAGRIRAACVFPFLSSIDLQLAQATNTIPGRDGPGASINDVLRSAFYVDCDIEGAHGILDRLAQPRGGDRHLELLLRIYRQMIGPA